MTFVIACVATSLFVALAIADAQSISWGKCPTVNGQENFIKDKYSGIWYEESRFYSATETGTACEINELTLLADGSYEFAVRGNVGIFGHYIVDGVVAKAFPNIDEPANTKIKFPLAPAVPWKVLATDYTTYSMAYTCVKLGPIKAEFAWIMRRNETSKLSQDTINKLYRICASNKIDAAKFKRSDPRICRI